MQASVAADGLFFETALGCCLYYIDRTDGPIGAHERLLGVWLMWTAGGISCCSRRICTPGVAALSREHRGARLLRMSLSIADMPIVLHRVRDMLTVLLAILGADHLLTTYTLLDLTPLGRQDRDAATGDGLGFPLHDEY